MVLTHVNMTCEKHLHPMETIRLSRKSAGGQAYTNVVTNMRNPSSIVNLENELTHLMQPIAL